MIDLELFGGFDFRQMNRRTDEWTFEVVESLLRLKILESSKAFELNLTETFKIH